MKRALSLILCLCLLGTSALALEPVRDDRGFADAELHWSRDSVSVCWQMGLMEGVSDTLFDPEGNLTVAQCAAVAARLHARLNGLAGPAATVPWYQGCVDYMFALGCALPEDLNADCTRAQFIAMMDAVVPDSELVPMNEIHTLPDTKDEAVLRFYRAGILTGMDDYGTFRGSLKLTRGECAAMLARIVQPELRLSFKPQKSDGSDAMKCLFVPADTQVMTIGGYGISAGLFTAAMNHALEVGEAKAQLTAYPEYEKYLNSWLLSPYAVDFERYLSENCGVNDYAQTDWTSPDAVTGRSLADTAYDEAMDWLRQHAAIRVLAQKEGLTLTDEENRAVETMLDKTKVEGQSRRIYVTAAAEDVYLLQKLCARYVPGEEQVAALLSSGTYLCAEFIRFEKTELDGTPLTEAELDFVRAGAELYIQELQGKATHYFFERQTRDLTCAYTAPRCTLWSKDDTEPRLWAMLEKLKPHGLSGVLEDETGIYIYLVDNPTSNDGLMAEVRQNYGEDLALAALDKQQRTGKTAPGAELSLFSPLEYAQRVF